MNLWLEVTLLVAMVAIIVAMDLFFFRGPFWERLAANVGVVLLFGAFYFALFRRA